MCLLLHGKSNRVGRLENVFILLKINMGIIDRKKNFRVGSKKWGWSDDSKQTYYFFGPIHVWFVLFISFGLVRPRKNIVVTCVSGSLPKTIWIGRQHNFFILFSESAPKIYGLSGNLKHFFFLGLIFRNADFLFIMLGQHQIFFCFPLT